VKKKQASTLSGQNCAHPIACRCTDWNYLAKTYIVCEFEQDGVQNIGSKAEKLQQDVTNDVIYRFNIVRLK
jgi:hypothetical protein